MYRMMTKVKESLGLTYPEIYAKRIEHLRGLATKEIEATIDDIMNKEQRIVGYFTPLPLEEAIKYASEEEKGFIELRAPLLTFPKATSTQWNGDMDHVDTITGEYCIYTGSETDAYSSHRLKRFKGAPTFIRAFKKVLGPTMNVVLSVDLTKSPSCRIIIIFRS